MILWVRHGQSTWNAIDRLQGEELSPPLTDLGREQALATAQLLAAHDVTRVLSSPAVRAVQTADIIAEHLGLEVEIEPLLVEKGLDEETVNVLGRIRDLLERELPANTVVVSHGDTIALAIGMLSNSRPVLPHNGSVSFVDPGSNTASVLDCPR